MAALGRQGGKGTIVRSVVWIVISSGFLVWNVRRLLQFHALGLRVPAMVWVSLAVWAAALGFWLWAGWRDLKRRDTVRER